MIEHRITSGPPGAFGSSGVDMGFLLGPSVSSLTTVSIVAGSVLGDGPTESWRVLHLLAGLVEVTGADDEKLVLEPERAVQWAPGERHSTRAIVDSLVVIIEATDRVPSAPSH